MSKNLQQFETAKQMSLQQFVDDYSEFVTEKDISDCISDLYMVQDALDNTENTISAEDALEELEFPISEYVETDFKDNILEIQTTHIKARAKFVEGQGFIFDSENVDICIDTDGFHPQGILVYEGATCEEIGSLDILEDDEEWDEEEEEW